MKIIKEGTLIKETSINRPIKRIIYKFTCSICGAVWEVEDYELVKDFSTTVPQFGSFCPTCRNMCRQYTTIYKL